MTSYNFAAGPAMLPPTVIEQIKNDFPNFNHSDMSILEISHRSALFNEVYQQTKKDLLEVMNLDSNVYDVLFLSGGATLEFTTVPLNQAYKYHKIAFVDTGHWAERAIEEAERLPNLRVDVVAESEKESFSNIPKLPDNMDNDYDYLHITTNNTIMGTAYHELPKTNIPLYADMSSNFLGQNYDFSKFDLIYASAQKNLAPAGMTVVVVKKNILKNNNTIPDVLSFYVQSQKKSALNTPPVFQIYVAGLVIKWIKELGGIAEIEKRNRQKAKLLYDCLDNSQLFNNHVEKNSRSLMNIPFTTGDDKLDKQFIAETTKAGLLNLKGHRLVGGMRASLYNAMTLEGVQALCDFIKDFENKHVQKG